MKLERLVIALEELMKERLIVKNDLNWLIEYDEFSNIISEILNTTYRLVGMSEIEKRVNHALKFDIETLKKGLNLIEQANPKSIQLRTDDPVEINTNQIIQDLHKFINDCESKKIDRINTLFYFELFCDSRFDRLLMTFDSDDQIFNQIQAMISNKLKNIDDDDTLLLWAKIKSWFNTDNSNDRAFPVYNDIIPESFFSSRSTSLTIREKCAIFIAKYIPLTVRRMVEDGANIFPMGLPGVAKILTITDTSNISSISNIEYLLIRSTSQTIALYELITNNKSSDLAKTVGVDKSGLIFAGEYLYNYRKKIVDAKISDGNKNNLLIMNIKRLIEYTLLFTKQHSRIEEILRQYKMGQEVIYPSRKVEFEKVSRSLEIYLQKDMCKFLIERNILAFGRSIGRNQIDLYHSDISGEDFIIEAKVYKNTKNLVLNNLKDNIVQLQSYMDMHDQPRGILAIYNFTNTLIMAPKKWLHGRIFIMCINLCDASASSRRSSIQIIESTSDVIELIKVDKV